MEALKSTFRWALIGTVLITLVSSIGGHFARQNQQVTSFLGTLAAAMCVAVFVAWGLNRNP